MLPRSIKKKAHNIAKELNRDHWTSEKLFEESRLKKRATFWRRIDWHKRLFSSIVVLFGRFNRDVMKPSDFSTAWLRAMKNGSHTTIMCGTYHDHQNKEKLHNLSTQRSWCHRFAGIGTTSCIMTCCYCLESTPDSDPDCQQLIRWQQTIEKNWNFFPYNKALVTRQKLRELEWEIYLRTSYSVDLGTIRLSPLSVSAEPLPQWRWLNSNRSMRK